LLWDLQFLHGYVVTAVKQEFVVLSKFLELPFLCLAFGSKTVLSA